MIGDCNPAADSLGRRIGDTLTSVLWSREITAFDNGLNFRVIFTRRAF